MNKITVLVVSIFSLFIFMTTSVHAYRSNENLPPQEAIEFQNAVKNLEQQRMEAHEKLKAQGGTTEQHKMIDDDTLAKARQLEAKRAKALKDLGKKAGIGDIKQGEYGTDPTKGRGALGDVDTKSYSGKDFDKIRQAAKDAGYTVTTDGDSIHIKELDTTVHRESSKYKSKTGSSAAEIEKAGGYGKETSRKLQTGDKTTEVLDNIGKNGSTLNKPTKQMKSADWQELGKMTGRNMDAAGITDPKFREQLEALKQGYRPESVGIEDMEAFQAKCRQANMDATQKVRTEAKVTENKLEQKLDQAKKDLQKAQQSGNQKKIQETSNEIKRTQQELSEHRQTQKVAEDSLKKNQPKEAKKILEETKPPEEISSNSKKASKPAKPADADDLVKKTGKQPADADDLLPNSKGSGKGSKTTPADADDLIPKTAKSSGPKQKLPPGKTPPKKYLKVTKDAATGAIVALTIFSTAEDLKEKAKQGDIKGFTKIVADNLTGGSVTITEQNVEKYSDYQEFKNKIDYANKTEYEAYILRVGKALRENDVSAEETDKIMNAMRREDFSGYKNKLADLKKDGKTISVAPPKLTGRSWTSVFVDGDEGVLTRAADVFIGIGDGLLAMPGKSKKFLSEANEDLYEIFGGIKINKDGGIDVNAGIFEKGVITELYKQKVESANNLLDIAKNEFRTYSVNKEIEEQKARKDTLKLQKEIREKLTAQGLSLEEANKIAKKAAVDGDWTDFRKARQAIQAKMDEKEMAAKAGVYSGDLEKFFNCLCVYSGGSLGGYHNPEGGCFAVGPLTTWKAPMPTSKKNLLNCRNLIDWENYIKDKKIFEEMKKNDELVYQKMKSIVQEDNARAVSEILNEIQELIKTQRQTWEEDALKAVQLFNNIKSSLLEKDIQAVQAILTPRLRNIAQIKITEGNLEDAINKLKLAIEAGGPRVGNAPADLQQCEKWLEAWKNTRTKEFPVIRNDVRDGKVITAKKQVEAIGYKMSTQGGNQLPPISNNKEWNELRDSVYQKATEMDKNLFETIKGATDLANQQKDPKSAVKLIDAVPKSWEINRKDLIQERGRYVEQIRKAEDLAREGDAYLQRKQLTEALRSFQESLKLQKDTIVQNKANNLQNAADRAGQYSAEGFTAYRKSDLGVAISRFESSVSLWPDPNLSNLIRQLQQQLAEKNKSQKTPAATQANNAKPLEPKKAGACRSDDDCPRGYVCEQGTGRCTSPFDGSYASFGQRSNTKEAQRGQNQADLNANEQNIGQKSGYSAADFESDLTGVQEDLAVLSRNTPVSSSRTKSANPVASDPGPTAATPSANRDPIPSDPSSVPLASNPNSPPVELANTPTATPPVAQPNTPPATQPDPDLTPPVNPAQNLNLPLTFSGEASVTTQQGINETFPITIRFEDRMVGPDNWKKYNMTINYGFRISCAEKYIKVERVSNKAFGSFSDIKNTFSIPDLGIFDGKFTGTQLSGSYRKSYCNDTIEIQLNISQGATSISGSSPTGNTNKPAPTAFDPTLYAGKWNYSGTRPDGKKRSGVMTFVINGALQYTIVDEDGQSNGSGTGRWTLESRGGRINLSLGVNGKTWQGDITGTFNNFTLNSNHGVYTFRR